MKTLLINGSPRPDGNTVALIRELKAHLEGEIIEISAFYDRIAPCIDCRGCWETASCVVHDGMDVIYGDDFDNVVIASPVYFGTMPGAVLSLLSRMQPWHVATHFLQTPLVQRPKKAAAIVTAGGKGNVRLEAMHMGAFFECSMPGDMRITSPFLPIRIPFPQIRMKPPGSRFVPLPGG